MACHIEQITFAGRPATIFCCGDSGDPEGPKRCFVCKQPADFLCDWPVMKPAKVLVHDLRIGDGITFEYRPKWGRGEIVDIQPGHAPGNLLIKVKFKLGSYGYLWPLKAQVDTERPGTCDQPVCDLHLREAGEDRHYCQEHWRAWEAL